MSSENPNLITGIPDFVVRTDDDFSQEHAITQSQNFEPGVGVPENASQPHQAETQSLDRAAELFAPVVFTEEERPETNYDHLFSDDYNPDDYSVEKAAVRGPEGREKITAKSIEDAITNLALALATDENIRRIISQHNPKHLGGKDRVEMIRTDPELRVHLGKYLMSKFDEKVLSMGDRVRRDKQKSPAHKGYEGLGVIKSSEYVPLLALSMIDGTFKEESADAESRSADTGVVRNGEHRQAARLLLHGRY